MGKVFFAVDAVNHFLTRCATRTMHVFTSFTASLQFESMHGGMEDSSAEQCRDMVPDAQSYQFHSYSK